MMGANFGFWIAWMYVHIRLVKKIKIKLQFAMPLNYVHVFFLGSEGGEREGRGMDFDVHYLCWNSTQKMGANFSSFGQ